MRFSTWTFIFWAIAAQRKWKMTKSRHVFLGESNEHKDWRFPKNKQQFCCNVQSKAVGLQQTHCNNVKFLLVSHPFCWCDKFLINAWTRDVTFFEVKLLKDKRVGLSLLHVQHSGNNHTLLSSCFWFRRKERSDNKKIIFSAINAERKKTRMTNRPSFLSAVNAERNYERTTNRPSFLSAIDAKRKEKRTTNGRSF